ncbi:MAG: hypothetical protein FWD48_08245 [Oscillospiraceae bacterium]|nr:hypothetical protein [Oscillospiraceae bacterium]
MKKTVDVLYILAWIISPLLFIPLAIGMSIGRPVLALVSSWLMFIFFPISFSGLGFYYPALRKTINPKITLTIYAVMTLIWYSVGIFAFNMIEMTADMTHIISGNRHEVSGNPPKNIYNYSVETIKIQGVEVNIEGKYFQNLSVDNEYTFFYLPNTGFVVDIVDENGNSILK